MPDFSSLFGSLEPAARSQDAIPACQPPNMPHVWLGKDAGGLPLVIVKATPETPMPSALVLRNFRFDPYVECVIEERPLRRRHKIQASVIRLTTPEPELRLYFLHTISVLLVSLPSPARVTDVAHAIGRLAEIFKALALPSATSLQGLWAEMLLLRHAKSIDYAVRAWHPTRRSLFDFDSSEIALDVKSSVSGIRKHRFKLAQLRPPSRRAVYIFSVLLTQSHSAPSIPDLWHAIERRLVKQPQLLARVAEVIAQSAGADWIHAKDVRFEESSALRSLLVFNADVVPRVQDPSTPDVTDIEFVSDLSGASSLSGSEIAHAQGLLKALLPGHFAEA